MKTILVLTDFSRRSERAAMFALDIALKEKAEVVLHYSCNALISVPTEGGVFPYYPEFGQLNADNLRELEKFGARIRRNYSEQTQETAPAVHSYTSPGTLGDGIREIQARYNIWMIVMGGKSRDGKFERFLFGSETREAIEAATCPVLLVPEYAHLKPIKKIGFATDLNLTDSRLIPFVAELAGIWNSSLNVIHVGQEAEDASTKWKHKRCFSRLREAAKYDDITFTDIEGGDVGDSIETYTQQEGLGLLAVVHRKRSLLGRALHTSLSKKMIDVHRTPLLVMAGV